MVTEGILGASCDLFYFGVILLTSFLGNLLFKIGQWIVLAVRSPYNIFISTDNKM